MLQMRNKDYDFFKWLVMIGLPVAETLIGGIGTAVGWEHTQACLVIVATLTSALGMLLGVSNHQYRKEHDYDNNHTGLG